MSLAKSKSCLLALLLCVPLSALAMTTTTTRPLNVRGGPDRAYEVVAVLPARTSVRVNGCISNWRWCRIDSRRHRGWVDSRYLQHSVRGRVPVINDRRWSPSGPGHSRPAG
ncbi:SH3 domain-containing protein [Variovorax sp. J22R115]|uniref:SH3 domain-containing protein n=1 Tax=Variovorax sp. J22R115 TaxID=3053509 RepID=UPI002577D667|nr:SH3 domain-containing protein [Variovorax sp. J22R115]MDM0051987.1 SH3 domain-containing protein [Variovorax sp. J22R115]